MRKACVVWLCVLAFLPQTAAQMCPPPGETAVCVGKAADAECMYVNRDQEFVCGTCRTHPDASCGVVCTPSGSTACTEGREAEVTCTKAATGAGGFGIAEPCQDPYIVPVASAASFAHPTTLTSSGGRLEVTLTVQQYRLDTGAFSVNVRAYCHNGVCSHPGPTMLTYPGDVVSVTLMNQLSDTEPAFDTDGTDLNAFRHANLTNVHTHGLHVDPYVDNVVLGVRPGAQKTYTYTIPADHMPGTHWYHSHMHGSSSLQVMGGLLGMWVIGVPDSLPNVQRKTFATDTALAAWEAMPVSYMTVTHFSLCTCNPTTDPFRIISYQTLRDATGDNIPMDVTLTPNPGTADQVTDLLMVNGQRQPNLAMRTGVWNRFELVNAVGDVFLEVEVRTGVAVGGGGVSACTMKLLSLDGVFLNSGIRDVTYVLMAPASRAGVAVMCESAGTFYLQSNPMTRAADHEAGFLQNLVTLSVSAGGGVDGLTTAPSWTTSDINRPAYVTDMLAATPVSTWEMGVEQTDIVGGGAWLGVGEDCTLAVTGRNGGAAPDPNSVGSCPHVAFGFPHSDTTGSALADYPYRHVGRLCDIEDVVINGRGATPHPMHVHVNHFQIVSFVSETGQDRTGEPIFSQWGEVGDWRDTMPALSGRMTVRHALDGYGGNVMVHCHFLPHEDMGMMDRFWVAGLGSDGLGADGVLPCTANGGGDTGRSVEYCNSNVPAGAFLDNYPQVVGTCPYYRQSANEPVLDTRVTPTPPTNTPVVTPTTSPIVPSTQSPGTPSTNTPAVATTLSPTVSTNSPGTQSTATPVGTTNTPIVIAPVITVVPVPPTDPPSATTLMPSMLSNTPVLSTGTPMASSTVAPNGVTSSPRTPTTAPNVGTPGVADDDDGLSKHATILIIVDVVLGVVLAAVAVFCIVKAKNKNLANRHVDSII